MPVVLGRDVGMTSARGSTRDTLPLKVGATVELVSIPPGRAGRLKVGMVGQVIAVESFGWPTVQFEGRSHRHIVRPVHLRRVERAPVAVSA